MGAPRTVHLLMQNLTTLASCGTTTAQGCTAMLRSGGGAVLATAPATTL
jgi:hypothetical protein